MLYLAQPYSDPSASVRNQRALWGAGAAAALLVEGWTVYAPIVHWHEAANLFNMPKGWTFWRHHDFNFISRFPCFGILKLSGWQSSIGVREETQHALSIERIPYIVEITAFRYSETNTYPLPSVVIERTSYDYLLGELNRGQDYQERGPDAGEAKDVLGGLD